MSSRSHLSNATSKASQGGSKYSKRSRVAQINKADEASIQSAIANDEDLKFEKYTPRMKLKLLFTYE